MREALLELDEQQLDLLTNKRSNIFQENQSETMEANLTSIEHS